MSEAHDSNAERLRRIREATEKAEPEASPSEPTADALTQKIVQELAAVKRQNDALATQLKEARQEQQKQAAELDALRSKQQHMEACLNKQQEQLAKMAEHPIPSFADIKTYIHDKLFASEVKLYCVLGAIVMLVGVLWGWNQIKESKAEPELPATTQFPFLEARRPQ